MKADLHKQIINSIKLNKKYTISIDGKDKELSGIDFRSHISSLHKKIKDEDAVKILESLKEKQEVKQAIDKSSQNGSVPKEKIIKEENK